MANARRDKMAPLAPPGFVRSSSSRRRPRLVWLAGLAWLLLARALSPVRAPRLRLPGRPRRDALGGGKPYYLAAAYSLAFGRRRGGDRGLDAPGAARALRPAWPCCGSAWRSPSRRSHGRSCRSRPTCATPRALGQKPGTDERKALGRLPQFYADMQEWRGLAEAVAGGAARCRREDRRGPASSARTTARPAASSTSAASSACRPRSRRTTASGSGVPAAARARCCS